MLSAVFGVEMLEAIVLINVKAGQLHEVSDTLLGREGVHELYSVAGAYDLVAVLRTSRNERLEELVTGEIAAVPGSSGRRRWSPSAACRGATATARSRSASTRSRPRRAS